MSSCIPTHALVSGLARRILHDGVLPPESDFAALLALRVPPEDILRALGDSDDPLVEAARQIVRRLTRQ
ncbi:MAG: hypothetical protein U0271_43955 [Polyangiaceae bacterium]